MRLNLKLGKKPAITDTRIARLSQAASGLPDPPSESNWYADVEAWQMLGNDICGDCVVAFALHFIYQQERYLRQGRAAVPTAVEAIQNYAAIGGYSPAIAGSDQGLTVMGAGGLVEYWARKGLVSGGTVHKLTNVVQITHPNPREWKQAIATFSGMGVGIRMPERIMDAPELPFLWDDPSGPMAGYHEMFLVGYESVAGNTYYDCVTWGALVRLTEEFLLHTFDEGVVPLSTDGLNANGVNAAGVDRLALTRAMVTLQNQSHVIR